MTQQIKRSFIALSLLLTGMIALPAAHADLLLEPYIGYQTGKWKQGSSGENVNGVVYGGRVGYQNFGFMIGLDYLGGKQTDNSSPSYDVTPSDLGIFVGYNFPIMLRVYGVYGWDAQARYKNNYANNKFEGTSEKIGVGFTSLPMISINLEYYMPDFTKDNGTKMSTDVKENMLGLTVSIPFKL